MGEVVGETFVRPLKLNVFIGFIFSAAVCAKEVEAKALA